MEEFSQYFVAIQVKVPRAADSVFFVQSIFKHHADPVFTTIARQFIVKTGIIDNRNERKPTAIFQLEMAQASSQIVPQNIAVLVRQVLAFHHIIQSVGFGQVADQIEKGGLVQKKHGHPHGERIDAPGNQGIGIKT
jgi:hypothetical protein